MAFGIFRCAVLFHVFPYHIVCTISVSDQAEDLPLFWYFLINLTPFRFILKFFRSFLTLLVIANAINRHIEVLLFSISFVILLLFGDVETENGLILCHQQIKGSLYFLSQKIFRVFLPKGGRSSAFIS